MGLDVTVKLQGDIPIRGNEPRAARSRTRKLENTHGIQLRKHQRVTDRIGVFQYDLNFLATLGADFPGLETVNPAFVSKLCTTLHHDPAKPHRLVTRFSDGLMCVQQVRRRHWF